MILIPELKKILILIPRTGSTSLKTAVLEKYKKSICLYRHMEADGVPYGYDRWEKIGVVRDPVIRLWSLYKFLKTINGDYHPPYIDAMNDSVRDITFSEWIIKNKTVFTNPYDSGGSDKYFPYYSVLHSLPENRKSQFIYLRPDLGTKVFKYENLDMLALNLSIDIKRLNETPSDPVPCLSDEALDHISRFFSWDISVF